MSKRVLNVGGCSKDIPLPEMFKDYDHVLLDVHMSHEPPDIIMDAGEIDKHEFLREDFDAVYCSHMLEHLPRYKTGAVFKGLYHALKPDGFLLIRVPDICEAIKDMVQKGKQFHQQPFPEAEEDIVREVSYHGIIYGEDRFIKDNPYQRHNQAFTVESLCWGLEYVGFKHFHAKSDNLEIVLLAFKEEPTKEVMELIYGKNESIMSETSTGVI